VRRRAPGRPRDGDSHTTQLPVLDAALTEFAQHGFAGASTRAIVERAGVTSATLYHHFGSKRGLYIATYWYALQTVTDRYEEAIAAHTDFRSELKALIRCAEAIMTHRAEIPTLVMRAQNELATEELLANSYPEPARDFVSRMVQRAVERGELAPEDSSAVGLLISSLLWGLAIVGRAEQGRTKLVEALSRLVDGRLL
jgi:AcrR family transcriptional regulator